MVTNKLFGGVLLAILCIAALPSITASSDMTRVYITARNDFGQAAISAMDVRHTFGDVISVELSARAAAQLERNPNFEIVGYASQWEISGKPSRCEPWPGCKDGTDGGSDGGSDGGTTPTRDMLPSNQIPWGIQTLYGVSIESTSGGNGVTVAVLDTGAYTDHLDLQASIADCKDFTQKRVKRSCTDTNGHGTHTAGVIAANAGSDGQGIYGVAPDTKLLVYKVCSSTCWSDDVAAAIDEAVKKRVDIISMSLQGSSLSAVEQAAIDNAVSNDVLVIAAAGNTGSAPGSLMYPAAYSKVVAVGAIDSTLTVAGFSARGTDNGNGVIDEGELELVMPGVAIESTFKDGGYITLSGTSMAAPHAAGLAAKNWQGSASATRAWLTQSASQNDIVSGLYAGTGYDIASGFGLATN